MQPISLSVTVNEVVRMMVAFNHVALVALTDTFQDVEGATLMMYVWGDLPEKGTYSASYDIMAATAMRCTGKSASAEAMLARELRTAAVSAKAFLTPCTDPNIVSVGNSLFDFASKRLMPFTPDLVFTWKSPIDFDLATAEFTVKRDGEPDRSVTDWFDSLSDIEGVRDLIWQLPTIVLRPRIS